MSELSMHQVREWAEKRGDDAGKLARMVLALTEEVTTLTAHRDEAVADTRTLLAMIDRATPATNATADTVHWPRGEYLLRLTNRDELEVASIRARLAALTGEEARDA